MLRSLAAALALTLLASGSRAETGDRILRGGRIYTLDPARPWATALVIRGGRIVYVGDDAGAQAGFGKGARVVDLRGRMVLPGFHDAHTHPMSGALRLLQCQLDGLESAEQVYAAVRACASTGPGRGWLRGSGVPATLLAHGGPGLAKLDELVPDRPAYLTTDDGYTAWVNSKALAIAGIDPDRPGPRTDGLARDPATGRLTGVLEGDAGIALLHRHLPRPAEAEYREALRRATAMANRFGITSVFDAAAGAELVDAYQAADRAGELTVRVVAAQRIDPARGEAQVDELIARRARTGGRRFRADAAKLFLDGEIAMHTAALLEPYADAPGSRGELYLQPAALDAIVRRLDASGFSVHMHAMGDRAVRAGLDALERARQANGPKDRRHQLAHLGIVDPLDRPRFGKLGVAANVQPIWFQAGDPASAPTAAVLGPQRADRVLPLASIAAGGGRIVASSDWPGPSMNPLDSIQYAITRQPLDGSRPALQPGERAGLAGMIAAYTREAAWAAREDAVDGSIEIGKAADLVVLDRNLFELEVTRLHEARVLLTLLEGEPVYREPGFAWP